MGEACGNAGITYRLAHGIDITVAVVGVSTVKVAVKHPTRHTVSLKAINGVAVDTGQEAVVVVANRRCNTRVGHLIDHEVVVVPVRDALIQLATVGDAGNQLTIVVVVELFAARDDFIYGATTGVGIRRCALRCDGIVEFAANVVVGDEFA